MRINRNNETIESMFTVLIKAYVKFNMKPSDIQYVESEHKFRMECLNEELDELYSAIQLNDSIEILDAIVDYNMFLIGTIYRIGAIEVVLDNISKVDIEDYKTKNIYKFVDNLTEMTNDLSIDYYTDIDDYVYTLSEILITIYVYITNNYNITEYMEWYEKVGNSLLRKKVGKNEKRGNFHLDLIKDDDWYM